MTTTQSTIRTALIAQYKREAAKGGKAAHLTFKQWYAAKVEATVNSWMVA